jgi:alkylation response protein AidB-like acyl-CoA dehydrogenase
MPEADPHRMNLGDTDAEAVFRAEARAWLEANKPHAPLPSGNTAEGFAVNREWERRLFDGGWAVVSWPREYGGRDATLFEWLIFEEEYYRAGLPQRVAQNGIFLLAPTVFEFGTQVQRDRILPRMAAVDDVWAQGWSEPNAGSDLAGITSRAARDDAGGGWRLSGQKTWTSRGAFCTHLFGLFRSDPEAERHRGLTYFLVPLDAPGVTVRPVDVLDGDAAFAEVFLDDVFVPDADVLGEVHKGWNVAMATTGSERGLSLRSPGRFSAEARRLVSLYRERGDHGDATLRDAIVGAWMDAEAYRLNTLQTVTRLADGGAIGAESSLNKVFWSEMDIALHEAALRLLEHDGERADTAWMKGFLFSLAGPIYAGTNEIQRNVVAERVLGLPRK